MPAARVTYVYLHLGEGPVPAGRLEFVDDGRASHARFRYGDRYLARKDRLALDPVMLPLSEPGHAVEHTTPEGFALFNGLRDAAPDGWGRHLMERAAGAQALSELDHLVASGEDRVGALAFGPDLSGPRRVAPWLGGDLAGETLDLAAMIRAAERLDHEEELDDSLRRFLVRGSSLGGARPKATTERGGKLWIAKFGRREDRFDVCRAERATMTLARRCGLTVPRVALERAFGRDVYLVERFDRVGPARAPRRVPFVSGLTLLGAHESDRGHSYRELAEALRRHGSAPRADLTQLFRRMVFNVLVTNTDDHLRNHGFLSDGRGWRLSPAYDLLPFPQTSSNRQLALGVGLDGRTATLENALSDCGAFGLTAKEAAAVVREMRKAASSWRRTFAACGLTRRDQALLEPCFSESRAG
jgi:serine/threonine-protein kinase HipA